MNYANSENGICLVDCSSEILGCEAHHVLDEKINTIWLSDEGLPQWLCLSLVNIYNVRNIVIRTIGWHCWHPYSTNPKVVVLHVSADGSKFKQWDIFHATGPQKGLQLFCCAPISCALYPFLAFEITEVFGGNQTYMNRLYLYTEEITSSPAASDISQRSAEPTSVISSNLHDSIETNSVLLKLEAALGLNESSIVETPPAMAQQSKVVPATSIRYSTQPQYQSEEEISDIDSDSLPLTLTLSGERHGSNKMDKQQIGDSMQPIRDQSQDLSHVRSHRSHPLESDKDEKSPSNILEESIKSYPRLIENDLKDLDIGTAREGPITQVNEGKIKSPLDRHDVSSLTNSHHDESFHGSCKDVDVSSRLSDLEEKMDTLLKAFQLLRPTHNSSKLTSEEEEENERIPHESEKSITLEYHSSHEKNRTIDNTEENVEGGQTLETRQNGTDTPDSFSVTSLLSKPTKVSRYEDKRATDQSSEVNRSTASLNRSSTAVEAIQVMRNLETLMKSMTPSPRQRVGDELESKTAREMRSEHHSQEERSDGLHPHPSRNSPVQPCLTRSHSPQKGPGGVYRKEKFQPIPTSSFSSSLSTSCSCAYSSFPKRVNPSHLDHSTPLLPSNLNLPPPNSHNPRSFYVQDRKFDAGTPHESHKTTRQDTTALQSGGGDKIAELVERLHKKIMERTLKEAELAIIRKTKKSYQSYHNRNEEDISSWKRYQQKL